MSAVALKRSPRIASDAGAALPGVQWNSNRQLAAQLPQPKGPPAGPRELFCSDSLRRRGIRSEV